MVLSMEKWRGKVAIVTGASVGVGAAVCKMLIAKGCIVVGLARRPELIEKYRKDLDVKLQSNLHAMKCDMRDESDIIKAFEWTQQTLGPIAILVNNAGVSYHTNLSDGDTEKWRSILETNVLGLSIATREAMRSMTKNNVPGHIIHISSVLGHYVGFIPNINMYSASKHAVKALTETLRQELLKSGTQIRVSSVSPGPIDTDFLDALDKKAKDALPKLQSEDVADSVEYILSTPPHVQVQDVMVRPLGEPV